MTYHICIIFLQQGLLIARKLIFVIYTYILHFNFTREAISFF